MKGVFGSIAVGLMALSLAACTTVDAAISDQQERIATACRGATLIHATFLGAGAVHPIPAAWVQREAQAWAVAQSICDDPASIQDVSSALRELANAIEAMAAATEATSG